MAGGKADQFETLVLPHADSVHRMARRLARTDADADDLVQETFVRAFRAFPKFELRDHGVKPWLAKILYNAFCSRYGDSKRLPTVHGDVDFNQFASDDPPDSSSGVENIDWDSFDEEIKGAVDALPPDFRLVLLLWSFEGLSYKEIADVCDCAIGTVMSRLYRARKLLAEALSQYGARRRNTAEKVE